MLASCNLTLLYFPAVYIRLARSRKEVSESQGSFTMKIIRYGNLHQPAYVCKFSYSMSHYSNLMYKSDHSGQTMSF